jgi:hypothetical protein
MIFKNTLWVLNKMGYIRSYFEAQSMQTFFYLLPCCIQN